MQFKKYKIQNRLSDRRKMVVPVKLLVQDGSREPVTLLAHTLDANSSGTRLGGFHGTVNLGQIVTIQYRYRKCNFRVIWIGKRGSAQGTQLGLECLEPAKDIWNMELSENGVTQIEMRTGGYEIVAR